MTTLLLLLACQGPPEVAAVSPPPPPEVAPGLPARSGPLANTDQLVLVLTPSWEAVEGTLSRYEHDGSRWQQVGTESAIVVGLKGLGWGRGLIDAPEGAPTKAEGDKRAPAGAFRLPSAFGYASTAPEGGLPYTHATASLRCVDDRNSSFYNQIVDSAEVQVDWKSAETMRRKDELYEWGVVVDHNGDAVPGAGSCIFLHVGRPGKGTVGCTAMNADELKEVMAWLDPAEHPVMVQVPSPVYEAHRQEWGLP